MGQHIRKNVVVMTDAGGDLVVSFTDETGVGQHCGPFPGKMIQGWFAGHAYIPVHSLHTWCDEPVPCPDCGLVNDDQCTAQDQRAIVKRPEGYRVARINSVGTEKYLNRTGRPDTITEPRPHKPRKRVPTGG